jgi:phosphoglycerate dehydrogenase-like enzyme
MVSAEIIGRLPAHATLIDVSRGGIVDHAALEAALRSGKLRAAALDVFEQEPLSESSPLWDCPNLIITPHVGGWTETYLDQVLESFLENVERVRRGEPPRSQVSRELEY